MRSGEYNTLPLKPCRHPGCAELVRGGGYCIRHRSDARRVRRSIQPERRESAEWHTLYDSDRWRMMRAAQLLREPFCRECAAVGIRTRANTADHITPHRGDQTLFYNPENLQSLCQSCHSRKTMEERTARRRPLPPADNV